jgi:hypothetical protein
MGKLVGCCLEGLECTMRIGWFDKEGSSRDNEGADSTEFVDQTEFVEHGTYAHEIGWRTVRK